MIVSVVGTRPNYMKTVPVIAELAKRADLFESVLVHTGQHYDAEMSDAFFEELRLPRPDHHLGIGSASHGRMTGRMLEALEAVMVSERPALVVVLGDTNSTLAGALAAVKLGIPVAHVEAGLRSFDMAMPEEINRRLTDHVSRLLFCPTQTAVDNLRREGIAKGVHRVGDVMVDALLQNLARARRLARLPDGLTPKGYYLATLHRQENVDDPARLRAILDTLGRLPRPVLLPLHPRTRERLARMGVAPLGAIRLHPPASYLEMLRLESNARMVLTDSGGVQKEAFILGTPCVTLREQTEWVETVEAGANVLVGASPARILRAVRAFERKPAQAPPRHPYGDGHSSERIAQVIARFVADAAATG